MKYLIILILLLKSVYTFSQANKVVTKSQTKKTINKSEIDRLYDKYKGKDTLLLYTPFSSLIGKLDISLNFDNKPQSITIYGHSFDKDGVAFFYHKL